MFKGTKYEDAPIEASEALIVFQMYEALLDAQEWMLLNGKKIKSVDDAVDRYRETYEKPSGDTG